MSKLELERKLKRYALGLDPCFITVPRFIYYFARNDFLDRRFTSMYTAIRYYMDLPSSEQKTLLRLFMERYKADPDTVTKNLRYKAIGLKKMLTHSVE
jgi:hypothetical protein